MLLDARRTRHEALRRRPVGPARRKPPDIHPTDRLVVRSPMLRPRLGDHGEPIRSRWGKWVAELGFGCKSANACERLGATWPSPTKTDSPHASRAEAFVPSDVRGNERRQSLPTLLGGGPIGVLLNQSRELSLGASVIPASSNSAAI